LARYVGIRGPTRAVPDQWQQAMTLMVQRINQKVAEGIVASGDPDDL
jgi:hypothetical protein